MKFRELLSYFESQRSAILDFARQLCEIESPSLDVNASKQIVALLKAKAEKLNCVSQIERFEREGYGEHLIVRVANAEQVKNANSKSILLLGHTDTVYPRGTLVQRPFCVEGDKVFAPGIFDMKSGVALMFAALQALQELNLEALRPITMLLSCDEEVGSKTGRELVEKEARNAAVCLVCEPSASGRAKTGRKGTANYQLKTRGFAAHAGLEPEKGASAILEISRQIQKLHALTDFSRGTTVTVGTISGGTASNVVPAEAVCEVDVRFNSMDEANRIESEIRNFKPFDNRVQLEVIGAINRPPLERTEKIAELYQKARTIAASFDYEIGETQVGGASDGNFVAALGVPVLDGLGVAGDGAHAVHEHILASDIPKRATLLASLLISL